MNNTFIQSVLNFLPVFPFNEESASVSSQQSEDKSDYSQKTKETGVSRYLRNKPVATGVDKYIKRHQSELTTSVGKYLAKQKLLSSTKTDCTTGVSKYLSKQALIEKDKPPVSTVTKYMARQSVLTREKPCLTSVATYLLHKQKLAAKEYAGATSVGRFLLFKEKEARKAVATKLTAKYIQLEVELKQALLEKQAAEADVNEKTDETIMAQATEAGTGVDKYLALRVETRQPTGVAKYVANKIKIASACPVKTSVDKYITKQSLTSVKKTPTSVAKYVIKRRLAPKFVASVTGVEKYLNKKDLTNYAVSSVAKYIAKTSVLNKAKKVELQKVSVETETAEVVAENTGLTTVEQYLQNKIINKKEAVSVVVSEAVETTAEWEDSAPLTTVGQYLRNRQLRTS